jgi:predicted DNA-binding protein
MKRTNIHLAPDQLERLKVLSREKGVSYAELVRRAVEAYLRDEDKRKGKRA